MYRDSSIHSSMVQQLTKVWRWNLEVEKNGVEDDDDIDDDYDDNDDDDGNGKK